MGAGGVLGARRATRSLYSAQRSEQESRVGRAQAGRGAKLVQSAEARLVTLTGSGVSRSAACALARSEQESCLASAALRLAAAPSSCRRGGTPRDPYRQQSEQECCFVRWPRSGFSQRQARAERGGTPRDRSAQRSEQGAVCLGRAQPAAASSCRARRHASAAGGGSRSGVLVGRAQARRGTKRGGRHAGPYRQRRNQE